MQPSYTPNMRQRPLQKSMFLPQAEQYPQQRNNPTQYQYQDMMKRSAIQPDSTKVLQSFQFPQPQTPIHQQYSQSTNNSQILNFSQNTRYKDGPRIGQFQQPPITQLNNIDSTTVQQLQQKLNLLTQLVQSHDQTLKRHNLSQQKDKPLMDLVIQQVQQRLKQSYIPTIVSRQTKQIYEHIFNFKIEISSLKEEITQVNQSFKNQMSNFVVTLNGNNAKSSGSLNSVDKPERKDETIGELMANFVLMESKLVEVQKALQSSNDDLKAFIVAEIQKNKSQPKSPSKLKTSTIKSTLPLIMLEYRELFVLKTPKAITRFSPHITKDQTEITINSTTYYIDKEGFLLDQQNRYIVDVKGAQIRLEEKHLALLKEHNVLS